MAKSKNEGLSEALTPERIADVQAWVARCPPDTVFGLAFGQRFETIAALINHMAELEERLKMAESLAADCLAAEMVLDFRRLPGETHYACMVRLDKRIAELEAELGEAKARVERLERMGELSAVRFEQMGFTIWATDTRERLAGQKKGSAE